MWNENNWWYANVWAMADAASWPASLGRILFHHTQTQTWDISLALPCPRTFIAQGTNRLPHQMNVGRMKEDTMTPQVVQKITKSGPLTSETIVIDPHMIWVKRRSTKTNRQTRWTPFRSDPLEPTSETLQSEATDNCIALDQQRKGLSASNYR